MRSLLYRIMHITILQCALVIYSCKKLLYTEGQLHFGVLYKLFISKAGQKCNCLIDFFATRLPIMCAYTHADFCLLNFVIDHITYRRF